MSEIQCTAGWCEGKEWCSITCAADIIGHKWHPVIIHQLLDKQPLGFNDLRREMDDVSSKVLSDSLNDLEEKGIVNRKVVKEKPVNVEYTLTEIGESLEPVMSELADWGRKYLTEDD